MVKSGKTIILFTINYPYNTLEHSFLKDELKVLSKNFKSVHLVPQSITGPLNNLSDDIKIEESLSVLLQNPTFSQKIRSISSIEFIKEVFKLKFERKKIRITIATRLSAVVTSDWLINFLKGKEKNEVVLYSFWFNFSTLAFLKLKSKNINIVSRCHNFDLYGNEQNYFYIPFQKKILEALDIIYPDSQMGVDYLQSNFPNANSMVHLMGVPPSPQDNRPSDDGVLRIVSCAYVIPRKRVDLLLEGLKVYADQHPTQQVHWTHIGEGPEWEQLKEKSKILPSNLQINFVGNLTNEELHNFYRQNPVDLFVNTSTKEGTPVSILEAISYGIPILATAFGGNKEVVNKGAGKLLNADPTAEEIALKISNLIETGDIITFRLKSKLVWSKYYDSNINYEKFCENLASL